MVYLARLCTYMAVVLKFGMLMQCCRCIWMGKGVWVQWAESLCLCSTKTSHTSQASKVNILYGSHEYISMCVCVLSLFQPRRSSRNRAALLSSVCKQSSGHRTITTSSPPIVCVSIHFWYNAQSQYEIVLLRNCRWATTSWQLGTLKLKIALLFCIVNYLCPSAKA